MVVSLKGSFLSGFLLSLPAGMCTVLRDTLEKRGALGQIKARIRAEVFNALDDQKSGLPDVPLDRQFLAKELNVVEDTNAKSVPLLYGIISHFLRGGKEESTQNILPKVSLLNYPKQNLGKLPAERNQKVADRIPEPGRMAGTSIEEPLVLQSMNR
ncbi:centrosomal protein 20 isoform 4-T4 [Porphyrio hochstetteri]